MTIVTAVVLVVAALLTAFRVPASAKGRGRPIVVCGVLTVLAFLLVVPPVYAALDRVIPGENAVDPLTKILLFGGMFILADQLAKGLGSPRLVRLVSGLPGRVALALAAVLVVTFFLLADVPVSSPQLAVANDDPFVALYTATSLVYFSYLCVLLVVAVARSFGPPPVGASARELRADRLGRQLMMAGFVLVPVRLVLTPLTFLRPETYDAVQVLPVSTLALVVVGLWLVRLARRTADGEVRDVSFAGLLARVRRDR